MTKIHVRPNKDFTIDSIAWQLVIDKRQVDGGFDPVVKELIYRRFYQFLKFLQDHGMMVRTIINAIQDINEDTIIRNSDLNDEGFYFTQKYHGKWLDRKRKDQGEEKEMAFLKKWHDQFKGGGNSR